MTLMSRRTAVSGSTFGTGSSKVSLVTALRLFAEAKKTFNRLDVLVNNAGVYRFLPLEETTEDEFHRE